MAIDNIFRIGFLNIRGQTGFNHSKQVQIEKLLSKEKLDVLNLQETNCDENTFENCDFF